MNKQRAIVQSVLVCANGWSKSGSQSVACLKLLGDAAAVADTMGEKPGCGRERLNSGSGSIRLDQQSVATLAPPRKIHRCFERVNQLLSLLVPVSDINRAAAGFSGVAAYCAVAFCGNYIPNLPKSQNARAAKYIQNE
ncbi:MAG: hypothetical protein M0P59_03275 [Gallionella sp.]|jgi:hypothetical protein|nr:hypothetical protein [Gallionella sp.]MCK9353160.1 hypothetical protein [Gallionella sp.]